MLRASWRDRLFYSLLNERITYKDTAIILLLALCWTRDKFPMIYFKPMGMCRNVYSTTTITKVCAIVC